MAVEVVGNANSSAKQGATALQFAARPPLVLPRKVLVVVNWNSMFVVELGALLLKMSLTLNRVPALANWRYATKPRRSVATAISMMYAFLNTLARDVIDSDGNIRDA